MSGGLHEASIRGTIGERLHIYIVHYNWVISERCPVRLETAPTEPGGKYRITELFSETSFSLQGGDHNLNED